MGEWLMGDCAERVVLETRFGVQGFNKLCQVHLWDCDAAVRNISAVIAKIRYKCNK